MKLKRVLAIFLIGFSFAAAHSSIAFTNKSSNKRHARKILQQTNKLNPQVLQLALRAHRRGAAGTKFKKDNLITIIDYSMPSSEKRLWVIDLNEDKVLYNTLVAHGNGSGGNFSKSFSNTPQSHKSSIGVFKTADTYIGKHGRSLNVVGLDKGFNDKALQRRIVFHSANYVSESFVKSHGRLGRSHGCPALSNAVAQPVINTIKGGSMVFSYYPDQGWMNSSQFLKV